MKRSKWQVIPFFLSILPAASQTPDWQAVQSIVGRSGSVENNVLVVAFSRTDLHVKVGSVSIDPALGLTSTIAFTKSGDKALMAGDLVLLESEIPHATAKLIANDIEISAIEDCFAGTRPVVKDIHITGRGDDAGLAIALMSVLYVTATPLPVLSPASQTNFDWSAVETKLGRVGRRMGSVDHFDIPRNETISEGSALLPPSMGISTSINFQPAGRHVAASGSFALVAGEVNPVVRILTGNGINVTAIGSRLLHESPRLVFVRFWGVDSPEKLASALKEALDKTNSASP